MFSALVRSTGDVPRLSATLGALVEGVAAGLLGHAVVVTTSPAPEGIARLADATGADLVEIGAGDDPWRAAAVPARGDWLMCLEEGEVLDPGWPAALERYAIAAGGRGGFVSLHGLAGLAERVRPFAPAVRPGAILPRETLLAGRTGVRALILPLRRRPVI